MVQSMVNCKTREYVRTHYPAEAVVVVYTVQSEYNDEGYDNHIASATVRDREGREVLPLAGSGSRQGIAAQLLEYGYAPSLPGDDYPPDLSGEICQLVG